MLVHQWVTSSIKFVSTNLYTWVERGAVRTKCLAKGHNTMSLARAGTQTAWSRVKCHGGYLSCPRTLPKITFIKPQICLTLNFARIIAWQKCSPDFGSPTTTPPKSPGFIPAPNSSSVVLYLAMIVIKDGHAKNASGAITSLFVNFLIKSWILLRETHLQNWRRYIMKQYQEIH